MAARKTDKGMNVQPENERADRNSCRICDLLEDRRNVDFFVVCDDWVPNDDIWTENGFVVPSKLIARDDLPNFEEQLAAALKAYFDDYIVVIDAHS